MLSLVFMHSLSSIGRCPRTWHLLPPPSTGTTWRPTRLPQALPHTPSEFTKPFSEQEWPTYPFPTATRCRREGEAEEKRSGIQPENGRCYIPSWPWSSNLCLGRSNTVLAPRKSYSWKSCMQGVKSCFIYVCILNDLSATDFNGTLLSITGHFLAHSTNKPLLIK